LESKIDKGFPYFKLEAGNKSLQVPEYLVKETTKMDIILEKIQGLAKSYEELRETVIKRSGDSEKLREGLLEAFRKSLTDVSHEEARNMLVNNLKNMTELIDDENDSIWSYILKNVLRPIVFINRKFHFVIGNPPWLAMQFMMDPNYRKFLKDETFEYKPIEKSQSHLFTHIEMATLFSVRSLTYI
jgi:hypothetical protein